MNKLWKVIKVILFILLLFMIIMGAIFIRFDIPIDELEETYFTENSHYLEITIQSLTGEELNTKIHYQDIGDEDDEVVVLLHGSFSSSHTYAKWAEELTKEGYRVIVPDLPYFGLSEGFDDNITSYRRSALVLDGLLSELSIISIDIAGNSLGGAVSWYYTSEFPQNVKSLTLIDSVYPMDSTGSSSLSIINKLREYPFLVTITSTFTPKFMVEDILSSAYGDEENFDEETLTRYYELLRKPGTRKAILMNKQKNEPTEEYIERLEGITVPIYIMWGEEDTWIPIETVSLFEDTCNIPSNHIFLYENLGHVPMEEDPETTIIDFIDILSN